MSECCVVKDTGEAPAVLACPACGTRAKQVEAVTVKSLVRHLRFGSPATQYYFCAARGCDVLYFPFQAGAPTFRRADLLVRVGVKETAEPIPVCYCFGVTRQDLQEEVERTGNSSLAEQIKAEVEAGRCACELKNPSGKCCLGEITRAAQEALMRRASSETTKVGWLRPGHQQ